MFSRRRTWTLIFCALTFLSAWRMVAVHRANALTFTAVALAVVALGLMLVQRARR